MAPRFNGVAPLSAPPPGQPWSASLLTQAVNILADYTDAADGHRMLSELFAELPSRDDYADYFLEIAHPIALDSIRAKAASGEYEGDLDNCAADVALMVANARKYNDESSQVYADARTLQELFSHVTSSGSGSTVTTTTGRKSKKVVKREMLDPDDLDLDDEFDDYVPKPAPAPRPSKTAPQNPDQKPLAVAWHNGASFRVADFCHLLPTAAVTPATTTTPPRGAPTPPALKDAPAILHIHELWTNVKDGSIGATGYLFVRPHNTVHYSSRSFMEGEVLKTNTVATIKITDVAEKCFVLRRDDFIRGRPKNLEDQKLYVCESRYDEKTKQLKMIKNWNSVLPHAARHQEVPLDLHSEPIVPVMIEPVIMPKPAPEEENAEEEYDFEDSPSEAESYSSEEASKPKRRGRPPKTSAQSKLKEEDARRKASGAAAYPGGPMGRGPMVNMPALPGMPMGMYPHNFQNSANMGSFNFRSIPAPPPALPAVVMTEKLSGETAQIFKTDATGEVMFYSTPPLDIVPHTPSAFPSLEYLTYKVAKRSNPTASGPTPKKSKTSTSTSNKTASVIEAFGFDVLPPPVLLSSLKVDVQRGLIEGFQKFTERTMREVKEIRTELGAVSGV